MERLIGNPVPVNVARPVKARAPHPRPFPHPIPPFPLLPKQTRPPNNLTQARSNLRVPKRWGGSSPIRGPGMRGDASRVPFRPSTLSGDRNCPGKVPGNGRALLIFSTMWLGGCACTCVRMCARDAVCRSPWTFSGRRCRRRASSPPSPPLRPSSNPSRPPRPRPRHPRHPDTPTSACPPPAPLAASTSQQALSVNSVESPAFGAFPCPLGPLPPP